MTSPTNSGARRLALTAAVVAGAFLAGALAVGVISTATAQTGTTTTPGNGYRQGDPGTRDELQPQRADEQLLTGDDAEKAKAAALAKYPGATIQRVETDSEGVYEAHLVAADGQRVTVELDENFNITGEEAAGGPHN